MICLRNVMDQETYLKNSIRTFPDFPRKGVNFYDITGLFKTGEVFSLTVQKMTRLVDQYMPDRLFAVDAKGFIFAAPVAANLGIGLSLLRKASKLPGKVVRYTYALEYGTDEMECRTDDFSPSERLVVIDDVLATGGTLSAAVALLQQLGGNVAGAVTAIEIGNLLGREKMKVPYSSMLYFPR